VTRLVVDEARWYPIQSTVQTQEGLRGLVDGLLGLRQRGRHKRVLPDVEPRVNARVIEHVILPDR